MDTIGLWREMAQLRSDVGDSWKWPSPVDSIRFAFQELAEADDELMRMQSPEFLRRRDETGNSYEQELGMCVLMLLSYFRTEDEVRDAMSRKSPLVGSMAIDMSTIAMNMALAWTLANTNVALPRVMYTLAMISEMMGEDKFSDATLGAIAKVRARVEEKKSLKYLYLKGGAEGCPYCGGDDLDTMETDTDEAYHNRKIVCHSCSGDWVDVYKLVDVIL